MNLRLDDYAHLDSPLHRWDQRYKFIGLMALIFAFAFVSELWVLPVMVVVVATIYIASKLPFSFMLTRLRYPSFFILVVILVLPFVSGETVLMSVGPLDLRREGLFAVLLIATKFLSILTVGLVLFGTAPFLTAIKAMRALGLPAILTDITLLSFRYLFELGDYLSTMQTAMRLRGFRERRLSGRGFATLAWLGGSILVRSYEQSEQVYKAMILRGYGDTPRAESEFRTSTRDIIALVSVLVVAIGFVVGDILL